jgi:hypothetical protein
MTGTMTEAQLEREMTALLDIACSVITETGMLYPTFVLFRRDGRVLTYQRGFGDEAEKRKVVGFVRLVAMVVNAVAFAMVSESWAAAHSDDPEVAKLQPMQRSDRKERVQVLGRTVAGGTLFISRELIREPDAPIRFEPLPEPINDFVDVLCHRVLDWSEIHPATMVSMRADPLVQALMETKTHGTWHEGKPS